MPRRARTITTVSHRQVKKPGGAKSTHPIKDPEKRVLFKNWFKTRFEKEKSEKRKPIFYRDYMIVMTGLYTAFRAEDLLQLRLKDVAGGWLDIKENKTGKVASFPLADDYLNALKEYAAYIKLEPNDYLFNSSRPGCINAITRQRMDRVIKKACEEVGIGFTVGMHGLRKTFGYCCVSQWGFDTKDVRVFLNHSSEATTEHYIEWSRDDIVKERRKEIRI